MRNIDMLNMNTNTLPQGHETQKKSLRWQLLWIVMHEIPTSFSHMESLSFFWRNGFDDFFKFRPAG